MDAVFQALAHADRRRILDLVKDSPGVKVGEVCSHFGTSRIAVLKHIQVLEDAGLLIRERQGRTKRLYHNTVPIQQIYDRWTTQYSRLWSQELTSIKYRIETQNESKKGNIDDDDETDR